MSRPCPQCSANSGANANFCSICGVKLSKTEGSSSSNSRVMREGKLKAQDQLEGSRKMVTILFADINGFTSLCEKLDPEKVRDLVDVYFKRLSKSVYLHEGYIDKFIGDCIMALFGAPIAHENDPELAIRCALKMLEDLKVINQQTGLNLTMSLGINSGLVVAGGLGSDQKNDFTVIGDSVNLAQRFEAQAKPNQILVGKSVYQSCRHLFNFASLGLVPIKGKQEKIEIFAVESEKAQSEQDSILKDISIPMMGRKDELNRINQLMQKSFTESRLLLVSGEAGLGKSRLKYEIKKIAEKDSLAWFEGRSLALSRDTPYFPFRNLLIEILGVSVDTDTHRNQALQKLKEFKLDEVAEFILTDLLSPVQEQSDRLGLTANQKKTATFLAFRKLILSLVQKQPSVIFFEDFHSADSLSIELFDYLIEELPRARLLLVLAFRPDFDHGFPAAPYITKLQLKPLAAADAVELAKQLLKMETLPAPIEKVVVSSAEGNPLYIQEILKGIIDSGQLQKIDGKWMLPGNLSKLDVPSSLQAIIASRIDRLHQADKEVLQMAAVIGRQFTDILLRKALGDSDYTSEALSFLGSKEIIFKMTSGVTESVYIFNQSLTQQVAYESILLKKRKLLHQKVAEALDHLVAIGQVLKTADRLFALAHHYLKAGVSDKAVLYLHQNAFHLASSYDLNGAIKAYLQAISICKKSLSANLPISIHQLYLELSDLYMTKGQFAEVENIHFALIQASRDSGDKHALAQSFRRLGDMERQRGQLDKALSYLNEAQLAAADINDSEMSVRIQKSLGAVLSHSNKKDEALKILESGLSKARELKQNDLIADFLNDIGAISISINNLKKAEELLKEVQAISEKLNKKSLLLSATMNLGIVRFMNNDIDGAMTTFQEGISTAGSMGNVLHVIKCHHNFGVAALQAQKLDLALKGFEDAVSMAESIGDVVDKLNSLIFLGYTKAKLGRSEDGEKLIQSALVESESGGHWGVYAEGVFLLSTYWKTNKKKSEAKEILQNLHQKAVAFSLNAIRQRCEEELKSYDEKATSIA